MTNLKGKYGDWAIVLGAAVGMGKSYCISLAKQGLNIVMVDNREDQLIILSKEMTEEFGIQTIPLCIDLYNDESVAQIMDKTKHLVVRLMIYNAAFSSIKSFGSYTADDLDHYIKVNVGTPLKLVHAFSNRLIARNQSGGILLMSSLAGLLGMQFIAPYAASKAFAWNLAESLHHELKPFGIDVMACIAGATTTEAYLRTNPQYGFFKPQIQSPSIVTEMALKNLNRKALFISGFWNRVNYFILTRLLPRKMASYFANSTMRKMYPNI
jgi:short-subunit dehydrogenase